MAEKQEEEEKEQFIDRYLEKEVRDRRKFPGGHEAEDGYDMNGNKVSKTSDPKTEKFNLF